MSNLLRIPYSLERPGDILFKKALFEVENLEINQFVIKFFNSTDSQTTVLNFSSGLYAKAHCTCSEFKTNNACEHIVASLRIARKHYGYRLRVNFEAIYSQESAEDVYRHEIFNLFKKEPAKIEDIFSQIPSLKKRPKDIDQVFYEFYPSSLISRFPPLVLFHVAGKLKNGGFGKTKLKRFKYQEVDSINDPEDKRIIEALLPYTCLYRNTGESKSDSFNGAKLDGEASFIISDLIKSNRLFLKENYSSGDVSSFNYLTLDRSLEIELKLVVDSKKFKLRLGFFMQGEEIKNKYDICFLPDAHLVFYQIGFYPLVNYLPKDLVDFISFDDEIHLSEKQFWALKDELLQRIDHRGLDGDAFELKAVVVESELVAHVKLPLTEEGVFWSCLNQQTPPLNPPFNQLTIYQDKNTEAYHKFIQEELELSMLAGGLFKIPLEKFQAFLEGAERINLKVIADKAVIKPFSQFQMGITHNLNWFEIKGGAVVDGVELHLPEILKKVKNKDQFIELKNGTKAFIPQKWIEKVSRLNETAEFVDGKYVVHESRALQLEALEVENVNLTEIIHKIKNFKSLPEVKLGKNFTGELREYQKFSLKWMKFLRNIGLGGCLADDMGLGKTVQVAANLGVRKDEDDFDGSPHLIVCPKSLVFNWKNELKKFTPQLKVEVVESGKFKLQDLMKKNRPDIIITTYGIIQRNCEHFTETNFDYIVLDEAQAVKNPRSLTAKAALALKGSHRLVLTGTPMENHVGELYSLFNFLMPGAYKRLAMNPDHSNKTQTLALRPFILRRTKSQVLTDLPDKVEQTIMCEQADEERSHYLKLKDYVSANLNKEIDLDDFKKSSIVVLEALTRLRQASCHPGLINPELKSLEAGKLSILKEMLQEILEEGHKVIIFSQFTTLLNLARESLGMNENNSCYLDGKSQNREKIVKDFQESKEKNVFFISLKAGGTGLNLTEASYCFILDPWWNPAVESQAVGRLHRIGQKKSVNVYRLISKDTIEEKVLELQKIKSEMVKEMISDENEGFIRNLKAKELEFLLS